MKRILLVPVLTLTLGSLVTLTTGCSDSCEDLDEICERCVDQTYRAACEDTVAENVQDVCNARISTYNAACPYVSEESSTSSGTTSSGTSSGTSSSGTGGTTSSSSTTGTGGAGGSSGTAGAGGVGGATGGAGGATGGAGGT